MDEVKDPRRRRLEELLEPLGGAKKVSAEIAQARRNWRAFSAMLCGLLKRYPNRWVAVHNGVLVGTSKKREWLRARLRRKGIDPDRAVVRYLDPNRPKRITILVTA